MASSSSNSLAKILSALLVLVLVSIAGVFYYQKNTNSNNLSTLVQADYPAPTVTPKTENQVQQVEVKSIYGDKKLIMRTTNISQNFNTYSFFVSDSSGNNEKLIFTKTVQIPGTMSIPANSWSPDNNYVFIQESDNGITDFLVFKASGELFYNNEQFLDIISLFAIKKSNYYITDVTGWDSPILIHVKTAIDQSTKGPAFWFDVTSRSFIQLWR